jgi:hypothetical protein
MTRIQKSVPAFKKQIDTSLKPTGTERAGKVTGDEMAKALQKLPTTKAGIKAAEDLFGKGVKMDAAAKKALQAFITKNGGETETVTPSRPTGVRTFESAAEVKTALKDDDFRERMVTAAFGPMRSKSSSYEAASVKKNGDGFDITLVKSHWRTRTVQDEVVVHITKAGTPTSNGQLPGVGPGVIPAINIHPDTFRDDNLPGVGTRPQPAINIHPDTFRDDNLPGVGTRPQPAINIHPDTFGGRTGGVRLASTVADVKEMLTTPDFKNQIINAAYGNALSRSSSYDIGSIEKAGDGFDITVEKRNWRNGALQDDIVVHINRAGVPSETANVDNEVPYTPMPGPIGGARPALMERAKLKETLEENARSLVMGELGQTLSRSDAVEVASMTKNDRGTYDVVFNVVHWQTREPRMELPFEVDKNGKFIAAG